MSDSGEPVSVEWPRPARARLVAPTLAAAALALSALALLDPRRLSLVPLALALAAVASLLAWPGRRRRVLLACLLSAAYCASAHVEGDGLRGDAAGYYSYLRSLYFDHDIDVGDEYATWGLPVPPPTATGLHYNQFTIGPALLWSPFFVLTDLYVRVDAVFGLGGLRPDGHALPYLRSMALGTLTWVVLACWLLAGELGRLVGPGAARLGVIGAVLATPLLYYVFALPGMAHGLAFAMGALLICAWLRARAEGTLRQWVLIGVLTSLALMMRMQAFVYLLLVVPLAAEGLARRRLRPATLAAAIAAGFAVFALQIATWHALYGTFLRIPEGYQMIPPTRPQDRGWFDFSSPHAADVLLSADRGLFNWTPVVALGVLGLLLGSRRFRLLAACGLAVFAATVYINGARTIDWAGDDAFGARRFDVFLPFVGVGLAGLFDVCRRRPLLVPGALLALAIAWNAGLVALFRAGVFVEAAPLDQLAARQVNQLRRVVEQAAAGLGGQSGRNLAYNFFVGQYFYWNLNKSGTIDLGVGEPRYLAGSWSAPLNAAGPPSFRWALYPQACVRFPLQTYRGDSPLRATVTARAPERLPGQSMRVLLNRVPLQRVPLGSEWSDTTIQLPASWLVEGENLLCFAFEEALPERDGVRIAAAISRVQLP
jgi:hypothetical protein